MNIRYAVIPLILALFVIPMFPQSIMIVHIGKPSDNPPSFVTLGATRSIRYYSDATSWKSSISLRNPSVVEPLGGISRTRDVIYSPENTTHMLINSSGIYNLSGYIWVSEDIGILIANTSNVAIYPTNEGGIVGQGSTVGIFIINCTNVTIFNITIKDFEYAIYAVNSSDIVMTELTIKYPETGVVVKNVQNVTFETTQILFSSSLCVGFSAYNTTNIEIELVTFGADAYPAIELSRTRNVFINHVRINSPFWGVYVVHASNVTIKNYIFTSPEIAIYVSSADNLSLINGDIKNTKSSFLYLYQSASNIVVENSTFNGTGTMMKVYGCSEVNNLVLRNNTILRSDIGLEIEHYDESMPKFITIKNNKFIDTDTAIYIYSRSLDTLTRLPINVSIVNNTFRSRSFDINIEYGENIEIVNNSMTCGIRIFSARMLDIRNNTVNGKPIIYLEGETHTYITGNIGQAILIAVSDVEIHDANISDVAIGIIAHSSSGVRIVRSKIVNCSWGIFLRDSDETTIQNNIIVSSRYGIHIYSSFNHIITDNTFVGNGIYLEHMESGNPEDLLAEEFHGNILNGRPMILIQRKSNVYISGSYGQIIVYRSHNVLIRSINALNTNYALLAYSSTNLTVIDSFFGFAEISISIRYTDNVTLAYNTFDSTKLYLVESYKVNIIMNNFYDSKVDILGGSLKFNTSIKVAYMYKGQMYRNYLGNYWSDHNNTDTNNDGIADNPTSRDKSPLSEPKEYYAVNDSDRDGLDDILEWILGTNPEETDTDKDDLTDLNEFLNMTNPLRKDTDGDGMPDGWEVQYGLDPLTNDSNDDLDDDSLINVDEYRHGTDPTNPDTDGDGMPDGWEVQYGLDPLTNDSNDDPDGDGLSNIEEYRYGTNPTSADTDGDGYDDATELESGSDPTDPEDQPSITSIATPFGYENLLIGVAIGIIMGLTASFAYIKLSRRKKEDTSNS